METSHACLNNVISGNNDSDCDVEVLEELNSDELLENYPDALYNGWGISDDVEKIDDNYSECLSDKMLSVMGKDVDWEKRVRRMDIAPLHVMVNQDGGARVEVSCVHDSLWEELPTNVSFTTNSTVLNKCAVLYNCVCPVAAVEVVPGSWVPVWDVCIEGKCSCVYILEGVTSQLKPCQFSAGIIQFGTNVTMTDIYVLTGVYRGFRIVDHGCEARYHCSNYESLVGQFKGEMDVKIKCELLESKVRTVKVKPRCVHALGGVEKADKSLRPITDCSKPDDISINSYMEECCKKFHYKSLDDVVEILHENSFGCVTDISNAYRSVAVLPSHRDFQGFTWDLGKGEEWYQDLRICFGLKSAPYIFTMVSNFVVKMGKNGGFPNCINYLDDFFITEQLESECMKAQNALGEVLRRLGFKVAVKKLILPSTSVKYLGIIIDTISMTLSVGEDKYQRVQNEVADIQGASKCKRKKLEQLAGLLAHCATVVRGGRTYTRRIYNLLKYTDGQQDVVLDELVQLDLNWWKTFMLWFNGKARILNHQGPVWNLCSDASGKVGFGAYSEFGHMWGFWKGPGGRCPHEESPPSEVYDDHINEEELWPVLAGLKRWGNSFRNSIVYVTTDNTQVLSVLRTGRSQNATAMAWSRELFWSLSFYNIHLKARWIPGVDNIIADSLSRLNNPDCVEICRNTVPGFDSCCYRAAAFTGHVEGR